MSTESGRVYNKCRICGHEGEHRTYQVKEMFFGTRQEFTYFECDQCQCLQLAEIPEHMGEFYGREYYSFNKPKIRKPATSERIETRILDVGCGAGKWLAEKYAEGHVNLFGCDPFIENDIFYEPCIHIKKCTIHEMEGSYDLIRLSDSFEHMKDPLETMESIRRLLDRNGICLISIPVFPNAAYDIFGTDWCEWDAPRHLYLYSVKSMEYLCQRTGMRITAIEYNSSNMQFVSSLLYQRGVPYVEQYDEVIRNEFSQDELNQFADAATELNRKGYGDHAVFVLAK